LDGGALADARNTGRVERRVTASEPHTEKPMRIGMMIETDGPGGAEVLLIQLSEELRRRGHTVIAVGPEKGRGWLSGTLHELGFERRTFSLRRAVDPGCALRMRNMLGELDLDVVHSHEFTMAVYGAAACRALGLRHVITMHGSSEVFEALRRRIALRWAMRNSAAMVAVSQHARSYMVERLGRQADETMTVLNGILPLSGERERTREDLGLTDHDVLVLAVGNMRPRKGHLILLLALAELDRRGVGRSVHLAVAGDGEERVRLQKFADECGLSSRVHLLGLRRDIADLQAAADISAMPSFWEGLPLAVLEGMFSGNPIVGSRVGGIGEAVEPGVEGFLVEPGSVNHLAEALQPLIESPALRARMGAASLDRAHRDFHISLMADRYLRLYRCEEGCGSTR